MKLYLVSRTDEWSYDDYDSVIVAAINEDEARVITPDKYNTDINSYGSWTSPDKVSVTCIGVAIRGTKRGVILASFNAG